MNLDENSLQTDRADNEEEEVNDEVLLVSFLNYAMEMPSPPGRPYRDPIFDREINLNYSSDFDETVKVDLR